MDELCVFILLFAVGVLVDLLGALGFHHGGAVADAGDNFAEAACHFGVEGGLVGDADLFLKLVELDLI